MKIMIALRTLFLVFVLATTHISCQDDGHEIKENAKSKENFSEESNIYYIQPSDIEARQTHKNISAITADDSDNFNGEVKARKKYKSKNKKRKNSALTAAIRVAAQQGLDAMIELYERKEPEIVRKGELLEQNHPAALLSLFSAPMLNDSNDAKVAYASLYAAKKLQESISLDFTGFGRQATDRKKLTLKKTALEGLCPPREPPICNAATRRYRTHDGTCNNPRKPRWGSAHMPFHRFLHPDYADGLEEVRGAVKGGVLPSARFVSLVVHGYREEESEVTMLLPQWGQLIDHDVTATLQPRSINGSIPKCCNSVDAHPSCLPIKVPRDDPFLARLGVRCLEFLRSAPAQRRDCFLSWREQTNQVTSYIDASVVYSSNPRIADTARIQRDGLLLFGRGPPREDPCLHGGFGHQCVRAGDTRAGEQPGLLALHTVFVAEHNRITLELADLNPHWSDEKLYQESRRIIGAMFQHITYREYLPLILGREVCRLFDLELQPSGYYDGYDSKVNPTISNAFAAAAYRFGHAMIQSTILRSDASFRFISNNVTLHEENSHGDIGGSGSLHRILRGLAEQRTLRRDEFMSPELTNHLFQSNPFPFGMDLAAINIQRGRDHGLPSYVSWRQPCGLSPIETWADLEIVAGPNSANRMRRAYESVEDIDLFVGGISERPVRGGIVGPTFACIIAQQFSNLRKGDRFWYENPGFESSFTPAQLHSLRQVSLSQILCRSLGSSNFLQPHAFLPAEFVGNERVRCGSGILTPISLKPWLERDPFHKEADLHISNVIETHKDALLTEKQNTFSSSTSKPINLMTFTNDNHLNPHSTARPTISNNVDFGEVLITPKPVNAFATTTKKSQPTIIDDKIDLFTFTTSTKPKRKRTTTKRPNSTIIDDKIDFILMSTLTPSSTTKRPINSNSPFSKTALTKTDTKKSIEKRSTKRKRPNDKLEHRSDSINLDSEDTTTKTILLNSTDIRQKQFRNEDNATKYLDNKAISVHSDNDTSLMALKNEEIESRRVNHNFYGSRKNYYSYNNNNNYKPNYESQRPNGNYYPIYPPLSPHQHYTTSKRPILYENNRPTYDDTTYTRPRPESKPVVVSNSPISNKLSTPFSYDTYDGNGDGPAISQINKYDNMAIPLFVAPIRGSMSGSNIKPSYQNYYRPTYATTRRSDLSTFLIVETTRRTTPAYYLDYKDYRRSTRRPPFYHSNKDYSLSSLSSSVSISDSSATDFTNKLSYLISNANKFSTKKPSYARPSFYNANSDLTADENDQFDGYLRPENTFYTPLKNKYKIAYNDYSKYNDKSKIDISTESGIKYVFKQNKLHKYYAGKDIEDGLYDKEDGDSRKRYAEVYDKHLKTNETSADDFVTLAKTEQKYTTNEKTENDTKNMTRTRTFNIDGRSKHNKNSIFANTYLVPFKLLTSETRPDNWVNVDVKESDELRERLPDVPTLKQDGNYVRELPRPFGILKITKLESDESKRQ